MVTVGPPALACEYSNTLYECQLLYTNEDVHRDVWGNGFCLTSTGAGCSPGGFSGNIDTGGWTDYPVGLTFNGPTVQGSFVAAVTGDGASGVMYIMQKRHAADSWGPWQSIANSPQTHMGPTLRVREKDKNYDLIFAN